jgi:hypothetical protein
MEIIGEADGSSAERGVDTRQRIGVLEKKKNAD